MPWVHVTVTVLSFIMMGGSILAIISIFAFRPTLLKPYELLFANENHTDVALKIENTTQCCGWKNLTVEFRFDICSHNTTCEVAVSNLLFNTQHTMQEYAFYGASILTLALVVSTEISLTNCDRADYDKLELRPIQNF